MERVFELYYFKKHVLPGLSNSLNLQTKWQQVLYSVIMNAKTLMNSAVCTLSHEENVVCNEINHFCFLFRVYAFYALLKTNHKLWLGEEDCTEP